MSKVVSFVATYSCLVWFKKFFTKCYSESDFKAMAKKYEDAISDLNKNHDAIVISKNKELEDVKADKDDCICELQKKSSELAATAGRNASNREATINGLKEQINGLKQEIKDNNIAHEKVVNQLKEENRKKISSITKKCADDILKRDKEATKKATEVKAPVESKATSSNSGRRVLNDEQVTAIFKRGHAGEDRGDLAEEFGSNESTVGRIMGAKSYKKVTEPLLKALEEKKAKCEKESK